MQRIIYSLIIFVLFSSCKKSFLEIIPKGSLLATTVADYDLLLNNRQLFDQATGLPGLVLGDDVVAEQSIFQNQPARCQLAFRWEADWYRENDVAPEFNLSTLNMYACNKVINEVMSATGGTDSSKRALRAEALANRAYFTFQLVSLYAKPYHSSTAATDPGFPIITRAEVNQSFTRPTLQQTYDFIITDLIDAINALPLKQRVYTRFSKPAAQALLGKVYLFMGRTADALVQFNNALNGIAGSGIALYDYNKEFASGGAFLPIGFFGPLYPNGNNTDFKESLLVKINSGGPILGGGFGNDGLSLSPAVQALYAPSDLRLKLYSSTYFDGTAIPGGRIRKYGQQYVRVGIQLQDLILLRAEARARQNDLQGATLDVLSLRQNRMPSNDAAVPVSIADNQEALLKFILEERLREFATEGYQWFDMRRLSVDPLYSAKQYVHTQYNVNGSTINYPLSANRMVLKLPLPVMLQNPQMQNNP